MKRTLAPLVLALITLAAARADLTMEQKMESPMQSGSVTLRIKGERMRTDMPAQNVSAIMDYKAREMTTLMHAGKMAMKMPLPSTNQMAETIAKMEKPKATGRKEKVGAWDCEVFELTMPTGKTLMWVAKDFPNYGALKKELDVTVKDAPAGAFDLGGMVVRTETDMGGAKVTTELVSVKTDAIADSEFEVPAGYQSMPMPTPEGK
jgi:hypothetical protein